VIDRSALFPECSATSRDDLPASLLARALTAGVEVDLDTPIDGETAL
jgi:hypothetical protein